ncbi:MAG: Penicillin amidase family protein [Rhodanobacteraceae bacterium]|jgi:acyl-homoserine-lactone acylase|nr:MAG: Penicillin amidase family protein [Rhodanobacteraceae bacterium]
MSNAMFHRPRAATRLLCMALLALPCSLALAGTAPARHDADHARLQKEAQQVTITRDNWGIPHIHGQTDADAVFGMIYAQCEDDFSRVQANLLTALGWSARADGEKAIWDNLRYQLFIDPVVLKQDYAKSPAWLRKLMNAWADGLNWYLATHPDVHPVIAHYEPWMALSFTEGSIGGDIERVELADLAKFYGADPATTLALAQTQPATWHGDTGSNGIAIAPKLTTDGHALLLINPHVTFNFRSESQMSSDEGLDAYGASTWGQFFIYQGFNRHIGWMHTSTGVDAVDEFAETVSKRNGKYFYKFGDKELPVTTREISIDYRKPDGSTGTRTFTAYFTQHGPIVRSEHGKWIAEALMNRPIPALQQSWLRTKATDLASYMKVAELKANSSNNTLFADDKGEIAFLVPQFVPKRDNAFDYLKPVDGSNPATAWQGLTPLKDMPNVINPPNGWVMNTNDWPWSAAGKDSPKAADYPRYFDTFGENPRGVHATRMLTDARDFTSAKLITDAFDSYLPAFARQLPILIHDYDALPASDPLKAKLAGPIGVLRHWDYRWGLASIPTTVAVFWGDTLWDEIMPIIVASDFDADTEAARAYDYMADKATPAMRLGALAKAIDTLTHDFGYWGVPWGQVNRYQRLDDSIQPHFDDAKPSLGVPFTSSRWGSLASSSAHRWPGTQKYYGNNGNSFVAVVEFGPKVSARAIHVGGQSGDPKSPHFTDQAERWASGDLRTVYFWPEQLKGHTKRTYHPGQ